MKRNSVSIRRSCVAILSALVVLGGVTARIALAQTQPATADAKIDPKDLTGQWQGTAQAPDPAQTQRIVFVISKGDGGGWKTVFNFIDLIARGQGIPRAANLTLQGWNVQIAVPGNSGQYQGQLSSDGKTINGIWSQQGGPSMKLDLVRATPDIAWEVPKPPPPPKAMDPDAKPAFDVATIKPNQEGGGGKGFGIRGRTFSTFNT